jgi:Fe-S-cluster containining protein
VFLSEKDVSLLGAALKIGYEEFIEIYCRWIPLENGVFQLTLREKSNYDCIFWAAEPEEGCMVYDARPFQCRAFPFWQSVVSDESSWKTAARDCPGMDRGSLYPADSIGNWLAMRQKEPVISRVMPRGES